jgi:CheY-like chemotaxis protein
MPGLEQSRNMLKDFYEVYSVSSGTELFKLLEDTVPDLILLNIDVPKMNSYEIVMKLKIDERFTNIPVVFLTEKKLDEPTT